MASVSPAFQFYASDFVAATIDLTNEQAGAYIRMLCYAWDHPEGLPAAMSTLARIAHCTERRFSTNIWPHIGCKFVKNDAGRFYNQRLEQVRQDQNEFKEGRSRSGREGARKRWANHSKANGAAITEPIAKPMAEPSVCHAFANGKNMALRTPTPTPIEKEDPQPPSGAISVRPEDLGITADFLEGYRERYQRIVGGYLPLMWSPRDVAYATEMLKTWPLPRLLDMAEIYLYRDDRDVAGKPKSIGWFKHFAPWCDQKLAGAGR
jgi:uncharacterized protein YdaU (DUF1376 family)